MDLPSEQGSKDGTRPGRPSRRRVLVCADEMVGLGQARRTLAVLGRLADAAPELSSLVLTGSSIEPYVALPPRCDTVKLPTSNPRSPLELPPEELQRLRGRVALAAAEAFRPDVALVDKLPLGVGGELEPALLALRASGCRLVLGLRDVDRGPADPRAREAVRRHYDAVVVYGPASAAGAHDDLGVPVTNVGYVSTAERAVAIAPDDLEPGYLLATTGAGHEGFRLLATLAEAIRRDALPVRVVMVTGPLMSRDAVRRLRALVAGLPVELFDFRDDMDRVLAGARAVVSTAGYNTVAEAVRAGCPALLVPRVRPSDEQLLRARGLAEAGVQDMLHPDDLGVATLRAALERLLARKGATPDLSEHRGAERAAELLSRLARAERGVPTPRAARG
jgi:predicted glycosyltransferase